MCCFATICFHHNKLKAMLREKCPFLEYPIFRDIPSDITLLARMANTWNSTEDTPYFTGIHTHILLILEIEGFKHEIESMKGEIINRLQDEM